jgi:hypothetical protein
MDLYYGIISQHLEIPVNKFVITKNERRMMGLSPPTGPYLNIKQLSLTLKKIFKADKKFKKYKKQVR